ncbi:MAG: tail fiber protein [Mariprofundaceae bacterium]
MIFKIVTIFCVSVVASLSSAPTLAATASNLICKECVNTTDIKRNAVTENHIQPRAVKQRHLAPALRTSISKKIDAAIENHTASNHQTRTSRDTSSGQMIGQIIMAGFHYAPRGWALCNGQLLSIAEYTTLFSLLGTTYGGDGRTTFALPDLRGRVPIHAGNAPGLTNRALGSKGGDETTLLNLNQMPAHNHGLNASSEQADKQNPSGNYAASHATTSIYRPVANAKMNAGAVDSAGGNQPHNNMPPFATVNYIIALEGFYPYGN